MLKSKQGDARMKTDKYFVDGPITADHIAHMIDAHSRKTGIGAHSLFLGQVRSDVDENGVTTSIEYSAYSTMAVEAISEAREYLIGKYGLTCLHVLHSLGLVPVGGISLVVMSSSPHRKAAQESVHELVELIKKTVPIWGKELKDAGSSIWKKNKGA